MQPKPISKSPLRGMKLEICRCYYNRLINQEDTPSFEDIANEVTPRLYGTSTVNYHINDPDTGLLRRGFLSRIHGKKKYRNYRLTDYGIRSVKICFNIEHVEESSEGVGDDIAYEETRSGIPLLGTTAAGPELEFIFGEPGERIAVERELGDDNIFAVRVRGTSMIGDCINDGDCVFLRPQSACNHGDIVLVVRTQTPFEQGLEGYGYATLKHFLPQGNDVHLQSSNDEVDDIIIAKREWDAEWRIQGKVIAVLHRLHST